MAEKLNIDQPAYPTLSPVHGYPYEGLTKLEAVAAMIPVLMDGGWNLSTMEKLVGRPLPKTNEWDTERFYAEFRAQLRLMEAEALLNAIDKRKSKIDG